MNYQLSPPEADQLGIINYELRMLRRSIFVLNGNKKNYEEMKENIVQKKSFAFAVRIVNLYKYLCAEKKEFVLSKQLLRSGTSIGANIEESIGGQSRADFVHKLSISYKEARETIYWLNLLLATEYLTIDEHASMIADAEELCKLLGKIKLSTMKN